MRKISAKNKNERIKMKKIKMKEKEFLQSYKLGKPSKEESLRNERDSLKKELEEARYKLEKLKKFTKKIVKSNTRLNNELKVLSIRLCILENKIKSRRKISVWNFLNKLD